MFIVYLYTFIDKSEVFVGLSDNFNFHLELEKKFFKSIDLEINAVDVVYFNTNKIKAIEEKNIWLLRTNNLNNKFNLDNIPYDFLSKSLKNKGESKKLLEVLEDKYMNLYYKYETLKENYKNINDLINIAIEESINEWKDSKLKDSDDSNQRKTSIPKKLPKLNKSTNGIQRYTLEDLNDD